MKTSFKHKKLKATLTLIALMLFLPTLAVVFYLAFTRETKPEKVFIDGHMYLEIVSKRGDVEMIHSESCKCKKNKDDSN